MDVRIWDDGTVEARIGPKETEYKAMPVPPHGNLIDINSKLDVYDCYDDNIVRGTTVRDLINDHIAGGYPRTIIPADPADKEGEG